MKFSILGCLLVVSHVTVLTAQETKEQNFERTPNNNLIQVKYTGNRYGSPDSFSSQDLNGILNRFRQSRFNKQYQFDNNQGQFRVQAGQQYANNDRANFFRSGQVSNRFDQNQVQFNQQQSRFNQFAGQQQQQQSRFNQFAGQQQQQSRYNQLSGQQQQYNFNSNHNRFLAAIHRPDPSTEQRFNNANRDAAFFRSSQNFNQNNRNEIRRDQSRFTSGRDQFTRNFGSSSAGRGVARYQTNYNSRQNQFFDQDSVNYNRGNTQNLQFQRNENSFSGNFNGFDGFSQRQRSQQQRQHHGNQNDHFRFNNPSPHLVDVDYTSQISQHGFNDVQKSAQNFHQSQSAQNFHQGQSFQNNQQHNFQHRQQQHQLGRDVYNQNFQVATAENFGRNRNSFLGSNSPQSFQSLQGRKMITGHIESETENRILGDIQSFSISSSATLSEGLIDADFSCANYGPGFYSDPTTNCRMFHVCTPVRSRDDNSITDYRFTFQCGINEYFNQDTKECIQGESPTCQSVTSRYFPTNKNRSYFFAFSGLDGASSNQFSAGRSSESPCFYANNDHIVTGMKK